MAPCQTAVVDGAVRRLGEQLLARQFSVDLRIEPLLGEPDVRMLVRCPGHPEVTVEVLAPDSVTWSSRCWDVVRIEHGDRRVWRGPDRTCGPDVVAGFVSTVLCSDATELARRHIALG